MEALNAILTAIGSSLTWAWLWLTKLWDVQLAVIQGQAVKVGTIALALLLLIAGFFLSRLLSRWLHRVLKARLKLEESVLTALETLSFYALFIGFTVSSLQLAHFPMTVFTVLGGALAIGIGFGSQNVMNNFISGLILMIERPIRAKDLVLVEGSEGIVERIGARSTRIRATDSTHMIVPNSYFLENKIVNWTLSDELLRSKVAIGVIYGSPTRQVESLIQQALDENTRILKDHEPRIIFADFGDNALIFEVYFWTYSRSPMQKRLVESEFRFRVDDLFREHDLVIAFPQRDVHLDTVKPLEVRLLNSSREIDA